jgi:hypothetical protein
MDTKTKNELLAVVRALSMLPCAKPFLRPVDVVALNLPDYLEIIGRPMDLGTIKKKLLAKDYTTADEFLEDVYLIFDNCRKYNTDPRNPVRILCEDLQTQFEIQWKMFTDRIKAEAERGALEEKLPAKREVEHIEVKSSRRVKIKEDEKMSEIEKEQEKEKQRIEKEKAREERERAREERERMKEERERMKEEKAIEDRRMEAERQVEVEKQKKKGEGESKPKEKTRKKVEVEYEEMLNFDKLTGREDFESVIKFRMPEVATNEEPAAEETRTQVKVDSIQYMKAALLPLVDPASRPLLRMNLLNAIFTVAHLP